MVVGIDLWIFLSCLAIIVLCDVITLCIAILYPHKFIDDPPVFYYAMHRMCTLTGNFFNKRAINFQCLYVFVILLSDSVAQAYLLAFIYGHTPGENHKTCSAQYKNTDSNRQ